MSLCFSDQLIRIDSLNQALQWINRLDVQWIQVSELSSYQQPISNAILIEPRELISGVFPSLGKKPETEVLLNRLLSKGINFNKTLLLYDDEYGGWAGRLAWTLDILGYHDWLFLNGGLNYWRQQGYPLQDKIFPDATDNLIRNDECSFQLNKTLELDFTYQKVLECINDPDFIIWDTRTIEEYSGVISHSARGGHIPTAVHLDIFDLYTKHDFCIQAIDFLKEKLLAAGICPDKKIVVHCQTHHRSSFAYLLLRLLGYPHVYAYSGSWSEWGNRWELPVEAGVN